MAWTDEPVIGTTLIKTIHIIELRTRVDNLNAECVTHCPGADTGENTPDNIQDYTPHETGYNAGDDLTLNTGVHTGENIGDHTPHYVNDNSTQQIIKETSHLSPNNTRDFADADYVHRTVQYVDQFDHRDFSDCIENHYLYFNVDNTPDCASIYSDHYENQYVSQDNGLYTGHYHENNHTYENDNAHTK